MFLLNRNSRLEGTLKRTESTRLETAPGIANGFTFHSVYFLFFFLFFLFRLVITVRHSCVRRCGIECDLLPSFMLIVIPDRAGQLFIRARDLTDFIARTAREPVLVSFVGGGARRSVVEDERGLDTERAVPLVSGSGTESRVEALRELERFRTLQDFEGSGAISITKSIRCRKTKTNSSTYS